MNMKPVLAILGLIALPSFAGEKTVTLSIPGMDCSVCPLTVRKALEKIAGVKSVRVDFDARKAVVTFDDDVAKVETLTQATAHAGYPSTTGDESR